MTSSGRNKFIGKFSEKRHFVRENLDIRITKMSQEKMRLLFSKIQDLLNKTKYFLEDHQFNKIKISYGTIRVLRAFLIDFHNRKTGNIFPKHETVAKHIGMSTRTVERAIFALESVGIIRSLENYIICPKTQQNKQTSNSYYLVYGFIKALNKLLDCKGKDCSLFNFLEFGKREKKGLDKQDIVTICSSLISEFSYKKHAAQQVLFSLQDSPISPRDGCDDYDYIENLPMSTIPVKVTPEQEILNRRIGA